MCTHSKGYCIYIVHAYISYTYTCVYQWIAIIVLYHESVNDMSGVRESSSRVLSGEGGGGGGRPGYVSPPPLKKTCFPPKIKSPDKTLHHLSGQDEVGKDEYGCPVAHEVGDRLHDVPAVVPPGQPRKEPELKGHPAKPRPQHCENDETSRR